MPWLKQKRGGTLLLQLHVQPGAKQSRVAGLYGGRLKLAVAAPPVDGRANRAVVTFLAGCLGLAAGRVTVVAGLSSRQKSVEVEGIEEQEVRRRLG